MAHIEIEPSACYLCGEIVGVRRLQAQLPGTLSLDGRPSGPIGQDVQRCPFCGYCAPGLGGCKGLEHRHVQEFVSGPVYQGQLHNPHLDELANTQLAWALVCRHARRFEEAGRAALTAAWACDDQGRAEAASWCRERALDLFLQAPPTTELQMLQVDLLRRMGRFEGARTHCQKLLKTRLTPAQSRVLKQQLELIGKQESGPAEPGPGPRKRW